MKMGIMIRRSKILDLFGSALVATLISMPLSMITAQTFNLSAALLPVLLFTLCVSLLLSIASYSKLGLILSAAFAVISLAIVNRQGFAYIAEFRGLSSDILQGTGELSLTEASTFLTYSIAVLYTLLVYWMCRISGGFYPTLAVSIVVLLGGWFVDHTINPVYIVPIVAGLVCQFARASDERMAYLKVLPIALIISSLSFMMVPKEEVTWPPLNESAEKVRQLFYDYFMFTDRRMAYSLNLDGYMPMGDRLGGPADPRDEAVMQVESSGELLLRGTIKRTYTGYSWTDNSVNSRYLFADFTKRGTRNAIFDTGRASALNASDMFPLAEARIEMLSDATSTIFVPHRLTDLSTAFDLPSYYNSTGEVFTTRSLKDGDAYTLTAEIPVKDSKKIAEIISAAEQTNDSDYAQIVSSYTVLPRTVEQGVKDLTQSAIEGAETQFEKALRIQNHLRANYKYTLDVPYPTGSRDFASEFLLSQKEGYCTYFATAMAVMCRVAGLPTRYVEGYTVPAQSGAQIITGQNAHAWVEVYFKGIGWLSFNPTPGSGDMNGERSGTGDGSGGGETDGQESPQDEAPPNDETADDANDESPSDPNSNQAEDPDNQEKGASAEDDQTPPEEDQPDDQSEPEQSESDGDESGSQSPKTWLIWLFVALAALGTAGWVFIRLRLSDPIYRASEFKSFDDKLIVWYRAILLLFEQLGQVPEATESPLMFSQRMREQDMAAGAFEFVSDRLTLSRYSNGARIEAATLRQSRLVYEDLKKQLKFFERLNWYKVRVLNGLGDFTHLP